MFSAAIWKDCFVRCFSYRGVPSSAILKANTIRNMATIKQFQRLGDFAERVRQIISEEDKSLLSKGNIEPGAIWNCAERLCSVLLDYCSYRLAPIGGQVINPFDDPFVGAALITSDGHVLGGHRKESRNEPHAEVETLVGALSGVGTAESSRLVKKIQTGLADKIWFNGEQAEREFVRLFEEAGSVVRTHSQSRFGSSQLILLSSLEPCLEFESQPSCSRLIGAFKPHLVVYGCDDTNAKGQGRPELLKHALRVIPNAAPELNVEINLLFYAAVHYLNRLHTAALEGQSQFEVSYIIANLDRLKPRVEKEDDRVRVVFDHSIRLPVHRASIEPRAPAGDDDLYTNTADMNRVLFINALAPEFLSLYVHRHFAATNRIPGIIVCPQAEHEQIRKDDRSKSQALLKKLKAAGTKVYTNVLRKSDEQFLALQSILRFGEHVAAEAKLYAFVKEDGDQYSKWEGKAHDVAEKLLSVKKPRRISIYCARNAIQSLKALIVELNGRAFNVDHPLFRCSFHAFLVAKNDDDAETGRVELDGWLRDQGLSHRFAPGCRTQEAVRPKIAEMLHELSSGRLDPIAQDSWWLDGLLKGPTWKERQAAGLFLAGAAEQDPILFRDLIGSRVPVDFDPKHWQDTVSRLNAVAKYGRPRDAGDLDLIQLRLRKFAEGLEMALGEVPPLEFLDVVWRYIAAANAVADSGDRLAELFSGGRLREYIGRNSFLLRELFFYGNRSENVRETALDLAFKILEEQIAFLPESEITKVAVRVMRLSTLRNSVETETMKGRLALILKDYPGIQDASEREARRCRFVQGKRLSGVFSSTEDKAHLFATYLFLRTAGSGGMEQGLFTAVGREIQQAVSKPQQGKVPVSWRGDRTSLARLALSEVQPEEILSYVEAMTEDEDESIKWAALVLAMDFGNRQKLLGPKPSKSVCLSLRRRIGAILAKLFAGDVHYWLKREFIHLFEVDHSSANPLPIFARLQVDDVLNAKSLLCGNGAGEHTEVRRELDFLRKRMKRILLVLPPLSRRDPQAATIRSTTPPLGLGSIGTFLLSHGHEVQIVDCHRFPELTNKLPELALGRDMLGFNVVTSSFGATKDLVAELRNALRDKCPTIVLGGHAVTLHTNEFVRHPTFGWDYLVLGDGEYPVLQILERPVGAPVIPMRGIVHHSARATTVPSRADMNSAEWNSLPWVDHGIYRGPEDVPYEPSPSRNGKWKEAHVVMSRGCAWKCSFCTEAILRGNDGENRRSFEDVIGEIQDLVENAGANHIQFIDDNLLPQIAARGVNVEAALQWADGLLKGLGAISQQHRLFAWRGIFRFEDFIKYQESRPGWLKTLKDSGCMLLAFGVEHGSEDRRRKLKGGSVSNQTIASVVKDLAEHGIATKGYFIVGGENEDQESTSHSIDLAISAKFTLAYFALFKNFRQLVQRSRADIGSVQDRERTFMRFQSLVANFDELIRVLNTPEDCLAPFGQTYDSERIASAKQAIERLTAAGFRFDDLFKYNDYHDGLDETNDDLLVWKSLGNDRPTTPFLQAVRRAYFEFYARPAFVEQYESLIRNGY